MEEHVVCDGDSVGFRVLLSKSPGNNGVIGELSVEETVADDVPEAKAAEARFVPVHEHIGVEGVAKGRPHLVGRGFVDSFLDQLKEPLHIALGESLQQALDVGKVAIEDTHRGPGPVRHCRGGDAVDALLGDDHCGCIQQRFHPIRASLLDGDVSKIKGFGEGASDVDHGVVSFVGSQTATTLVPDGSSGKSVADYVLVPRSASATGE